MMSARTLNIDLQEQLYRRFLARVSYQGKSANSLTADLVSRWIGDWGKAPLAYVVEAGQDLRNIAELMYGDPELYWTIAHFNELPFPVLVEAGQRLLIPEPGTGPTGLAPQTSIPWGVRKVTLPISLQLDIARRFRARASFEGSTSTAWLYELIAHWTGTWPTKTVEHKVARGEDLPTIAFRYYAEAGKYLTIRYFNGISDLGGLREGQRLLIPEPRSAGILPQGESPFIFGIHDNGGEHLMFDVDRKGWVLVTEAVGRNPFDQTGRDYSDLADEGFGVIVRLNHGYHDPDTHSYPGTIPKHELDSHTYQEFAVRCANFVQNSTGCHVWIIGNETNHPNEWPGGLQGQPITPQMYADCFRRCYDEIHLRPGRAEDQVVLGAVAPWNASVRYAGNERGDWIRYFSDVLSRVASRCDGIALHTYTHGPEAERVTADTRMWEPFGDRRYEFRAYQDFMEAIPSTMRHLPVYITETNQTEPWSHRHSGWVQAAYGEINKWNHDPAHQRIRCLLLYRWLPYDQWSFAGVREVIDDFRAALSQGYRWW